MLTGTGSEPDESALRAAQEQRWRAVDPLLPAPVPIGARRLTVPHGVASVRYEELDIASITATWTALRGHALTAHVAGPDPAGALGALLDSWERGLRAEPGDDDCALSLQWPSRDTVVMPALLRRGFVPAVVLAVRPTGRVAEVEMPGVTIRPLREPDLTAAVGLAVELVRFDAQFGAVTERPSTAARMAESLRGQLGHHDPRAWVAERAGLVVGLCMIDPPVEAGWISGQCAIGPAGYLASLVVAPAARSAGIGAALIARADAALAATGAVTTLLHHALPNPLSTPFWHRHGYRPLWTMWQRRPAVRR